MSPIKTVLAPTDFSHCGNVAAAYAMQMAAQVHGNVVLVHVFKDPAMKDVAVAELHELERAIERADVPLRSVAVCGDARDEIGRVAADERADVIVIGTHGRSGLAHLFLGSVTEAVLRAATIPVLAVGRCAMDAARQQAVAP